MSARFSLPFAERCLDRLLPWLCPHAELIEVAGSIRRRCQSIGDIDLVIIPKTTPETDLFGAATSHRNLTSDEVRRRCAELNWPMRTDGPNCQIFESAGVQVDIWYATPETKGTVLMCRTGSKEHNIWLADAAAARGAHWNPHHGLQIGGRVLAGTEDEIYRAIGIDFLPPEARNHSFPKPR